MPKTPPKTTIIGTKVTAAQSALIRAAAEQAGMTVSEWVRTVVVERALAVAAGREQG